MNYGRKAEDWTEASVTRTCLLCQSNESKIIARRMQFGLNLTTVICTKCGLVYTNPVPDEKLYNQFYRDAYADYYGHIASGIPLTLGRQEPQHIKHVLDILQHYSPTKIDRLLEIGPGKGQFLYWAQKRGITVQGIEPSTTFHELLLSNNLPSINSSLENISPANFDPFNCIVMSHVLEHFYDVNQALRICRELLLPNGILVVDIPSILKPYRSLDRYFLRYVHLTNFSPFTAQAILQKHGFTVIYQDHRENVRWYEPQSLFLIAQKLELIGSEIQLPTQSFQEVIDILESYRRIWRFIKGPRWHIHQKSLSILRLMKRGLRFVNRKIAK